MSKLKISSNESISFFLYFVNFIPKKISKTPPKLFVLSVIIKKF